MVTRLGRNFHNLFALSNTSNCCGAAAVAAYATAAAAMKIKNKLYTNACTVVVPKRKETLNRITSNEQRQKQK